MGGGMTGPPMHGGRRHYKHCALHVYIAHYIHYQQLNKHSSLAYQQVRHRSPPLLRGGGSVHTLQYVAVRGCVGVIAPPSPRPPPSSPAQPDRN
jgi:hypothetical protein